jgi:hypothetical protein
MSLSKESIRIDMQLKEDALQAKKDIKLLLLGRLLLFYFLD